MSRRAAEPTPTPYGAWTSPVSPAMLTRGQMSFFELTADGAGGVLWSEFRPAEQGRVAVMRWSDGSVAEVAPGFDARTLVHEYGGASVAAGGGKVLATRREDQRVYRIDLDVPVPITPEPPRPRAIRYADGVVAGGRMIAVQEDHTAGPEPANRLVSLALDGSGEPVVLDGAHDFVSSPRVSPDGDRLAWLAWDHPAMPWDRTELWVAHLGPDGATGARRIPPAGDEAMFQPVWSPRGDLHVVTDRTGWWNLYRVDGDDLLPVAPGAREMGLPAWQFGLSTVAFLDDGRPVTAVADRGLWSLEVDGRPIDLGERQAFGGRIATAGGRVWAVFGGPAEPMSLLAVDPDTAEVEIVRRSTDERLEVGFVSRPVPIEYPTRDGATAHAFFYPPANEDHAAPDGELPPLIVMSHGGPTSQTHAAFNLGTQFWTTRGFAVVDVNYRGSTGFGRAYRDALRERWGEVDVADCVDAARHLAGAGTVDPGRLAIRGGSAGGYVTLCALVFHDTFAAGTSYCGVADIRALMSTTHKFESRYDTGLLGPLPDAEDRYHDRSPINFADRMSCPALIIQGSEDPIVTPDQAEVMVDALRANGLPHAYMVIEGEDHFLAKSSTVVATRNAELSFYGQLFGFEPAGEVPRLRIENLDR